VEPLGREADLGLEDLDEPAVAEPHACRDITDGYGARSAERVECEADGVAGPQGARQTFEERRFHDTKRVHRSGRGQEPLAKLTARSSPQCLEVDVRKGLVQVVEVGEQLADQEGVVGAEAARQGLPQGRQLRAQPAAGEIGQDAGVRGAGDEGVEHGARPRGHGWPRKRA
jgi:hypothetical protein